jgi:hypothetical protein
MNKIVLEPNQIITLNDYPIHSNRVLKEYFNKCKTNEKLAFVPVMGKDIVKQHLSNELLKELESFEADNYSAVYFMLDGSHRTTALTLNHHKIEAVIYKTDEDIIGAKQLVGTGEILENGTLDHDIEGNCKILDKHFSEKPYFMTVKQKTDKMVEEKIIPQDMIDCYINKQYV